jgi:hypothetical protein
MGHFNDIESLEKGREINVGLVLVILCYLLYELLHTENVGR